MGSPGQIGLTPYTYIVLFDGVCNLCSGSVQFILKRDPSGKFRFASLQSEFGQHILTRLGMDPDSHQSIVLLRGETHYIKSDAALEIALHLSGLWPLLYGFKVIPRFIRNPVYDWISRNRYRWFGKREACWLPSAQWKSRFLDT